MGGLFDLFGAVITGGMTGILGGGLQLLFGWLNAKAEITKMEKQGALEVALIKARSDAALAEWGARKDIAAVEAEGRAAVADANALAESHKADSRSLLEGVEAPQGKGFWSKLVQGTVYLLLGIMEGFRAFIRPGMTTYLVILTTLLYLDAKALVDTLGLQWRVEVAQDVYLQIVKTILYLTVTAISWWFLSRKVPNIFEKK
jgi:hypothetical protein